MAAPPRRGDVPGIQIHVVRRLHAPRQGVWPFVGSDRGLERWLADRAEVDLESGGGLRLETLREDASPIVERARTRSLEPGRSWILDFRRDDPQWEGSTYLELALHDADGACDLEVFQEGFQRQALSSCLTIWEEYRRRWWGALDRLEDALRSPSAP